MKLVSIKNYLIRFAMIVLLVNFKILNKIHSWLLKLVPSPLLATDKMVEDSAPKAQDPPSTQAPAAPTHENSVIIEYPEVRLKYTEDPIYAVCPYCRQTITTELKERVGAFTMLTFMCFLHCFLCCIPFLVPRFKDVDHHCSNCKSLIGRFKRI